MNALSHATTGVCEAPWPWPHARKPPPDTFTNHEKVRSVVAGLSETPGIHLDFLATVASRGVTRVQRSPRAYRNARRPSAFAIRKLVRTLSTRFEAGEFATADANYANRTGCSTADLIMQAVSEDRTLADGSDGPLTPPMVLRTKPPSDPTKCSAEACSRAPWEF